MDALSDVLRVARLTGGVFLHAEFTDPWCMLAKVGPEDCAPFLGETAHLIHYHYVLEGRLRVQIPGQAPIELSADEVVMFPGNDPHLLGGDLHLPPIEGRDVVQLPKGGGLAKIRLGGGEGNKTRVVCGYLGCEAIEGNPLVSTLPSALSLNVADGGSADWIRSTFTYAADEVAAGRAGSETVLAKLSELLFVEAIRRYAERLPEGQTGWLAGLKDPHVSRALALLHARVKHDWTVDELGWQVGLSRSALADRFGQMIGEAPMQYLTNWRMQVAAQELCNSDKSLLQVADQVGYNSEAAFARAFKRIMGVPPATWRRQRSDQG